MCQGANLMEWRHFAPICRWTGKIEIPPTLQWIQCADSLVKISTFCVCRGQQSVLPIPAVYSRKIGSYIWFLDVSVISSNAELRHTDRQTDTTHYHWQLPMANKDDCWHLTSDHWLNTDHWQVPRYMAVFAQNTTVYAQNTTVFV